MMFRESPGFVLLLVFVLAASAAPVTAQDTSVEIISVDEQPFETRASETGPVAVNRVLAVVGEQVLTMGDYRKRYADTELTYARLRPLVNRMLLKEAARSRDVSFSESRLDRLVERQMQRFSSAPGGLQRVLDQRGLTRDAYRRQLRRRIEKQALESRLLPEFFPALDESDTRPASVSVRARLILVDSVSRAWQIYDWLNDQPSELTWNRLFDRYSRQLSLMGSHGDLGWFQWGHFNRQVEYRIFKLPLYTVSKPFRLRNGYALVYPTGYRFTPDKTPGKTALRAYRRYQRRYYRGKLYEKLRNNYSVNYPASVQRQLELPE